MAVNAEGLVVANAAGLELDVVYEAIAILSGTLLSHVR
jgi:3-hydroxyisobutyrate dehydrogenase-like beta-hydroxyacid dehydrogenase